MVPLFERLLAISRPSPPPHATPDHNNKRCPKAAGKAVSSSLPGSFDSPP
jgi:hypothetical protein